MVSEAAVGVKSGTFFFVFSKAASKTDHSGAVSARSSTLHALSPKP